eukprot:GSA120T00004278001.1
MHSLTFALALPFPLAQYQPVFVKRNIISPTCSSFRLLRYKKIFCLSKSATSRSLCLD